MEILNTSFLQSLGYALAHSLWIGALVAIIMSILLRWIPTKKAHLRYIISVSALMIIFMSSIYNFWAFYLATSYASEGIFTNITLMLEGQTFSEEGAQTWLAIIREIIIANAGWITMFWALGMIFFISKIGIGLRKVSMIKKSSRILEHPKVVSVLNALLQKSGITKPVELRESINVGAPSVMGWLRPCIYLPIGLVNNLSVDEVESILAHEIAHIMRNDFSINILVHFMEAFFYFHPAVWWISNYIKAEREYACDDIAIDLLGNNLTYAKSLVHLQELEERSSPALALAFSNKRSPLYHRLTRILNKPNNRKEMKQKILASTILLMSIIMISATYTIDSRVDQTQFTERFKKEEKGQQTDLDRFSKRYLKKDKKETKKQQDPEKEQQNVNDRFSQKKREEMKAQQKVLEQLFKQQKERREEEQNIMVEFMNLMKEGKDSEDAVELMKEFMEKQMIQVGSSSDAYHFSSDTIPDGSSIYIIDGKVTRLKIDGQIIPEADYPKYQELIDRAKGENEEGGYFFYNGKLKSMEEALEKDAERKVRRGYGYGNIDEEELERIMERSQEAMDRAFETLEDFDFEMHDVDLSNMDFDMPDMNFVMPDLEDMVGDFHFEMHDFDISEVTDILEEMNHIDHISMAMPDLTEMFHDLDFDLYFDMDMDKLRDNGWLDMGHEFSNLKEAFRKEIEKSQLSNKDNIDLSLDYNDLYIDGKKQSSETHQNFLDIFERETGKKLDKGSSIFLEISSRKSDNSKRI